MLLRRAMLLPRLLRPIGTHRTFQTNNTEKYLDFDDTKKVFAEKSTWEVTRGWMVFQICGIKYIVKNSGRLWELCEKTFGTRLTVGACRSTFFAHFCAGETHAQVLEVCKKLNSAGIGAILDYAAEKDVPRTAESLKPHDGVISARIYEYEDERNCDENAKISLEAILTASKQADGFAAVKMTSLGRPELLRQLTEVLNSIRSTFSHLEGSGNCDSYSTVVSWNMFERTLKKEGITASTEEMRKVFDGLDKDEDGLLHFREWVEELRPETIHQHPFYLLIQPDYSKQLKILTEKEKRELNNLLERVELLAAAAAKYKVRLMIDAEQTYFQPAIDHVVHLLQCKYNTEAPVIYTTIQCYLKDAIHRVRLDLERAALKKYCYAAKVVRGAYMNQERLLAQTNNYEDPIHPTIQRTQDTYHTVISAILQSRPTTRSEVMIATHNETTVRFAARLVSEMKIDSGVFFGQLMGMCDYITFALAANGYKVFKYVPYGPIKEVLPYLIRRAEENADVLSGAVKEKRLLSQELRRRLFSRQ